MNYWISRKNKWTTSTTGSKYKLFQHSVNRGFILNIKQATSTAALHRVADTLKSTDYLRACECRLHNCDTLGEHD